MAHPTNRKWVITPVINGISRVNPLITGVITHLLSGMSHQAVVSSYDQEGDLHSLIYLILSRMLKAWKLAREKQLGDMISSITIWIGSSRQRPQEDGCQLISITHFTQSTYVVSINQSVHLINGAYTCSNLISVVQFKSLEFEDVPLFLMPFKEHLFVNSRDSF